MAITALLAIGLCARGVYAALSAWQRRRQLNGAIPLAMSEEDADEDERDPGRKPSRVTTVDLDQLLNDDDFPA